MLVTKNSAEMIKKMSEKSRSSTDAIPGSCGAVMKEIDNLILKFEHFNERCSGILAALISNFENLNRDLQQSPPDSKLSDVQRERTKQAVKDMLRILPVIAQEHRDLHGSVSKIGKFVDRNFTPDYSTIERANLFDDAEIKTALNRLVFHHLYREGYDDIGDFFVNECCVEKPVVEFAANECHKEIQQIVQAILDYDVRPALAWIVKYNTLLEPLKSSLEYKLHRLAFLQILHRGVGFQLEAVTYSKLHLQKFFGKFESDILNLMGALAYARRGLNGSPYAHLLSEEMWTEAADHFQSESCKVMNMTPESHLAISINAGCRAIPALQNMKQVIQSQQIFGIWQDLEELPVEIDLGMDYTYHSVFACPILRQRSSKENPPMKLACGHVITNEALFELSVDGVFKCPYCPMEQSASHARIAYF